MPVEAAEHLTAVHDRAEPAAVRAAATWPLTWVALWVGAHALAAPLLAGGVRLAGVWVADLVAVAVLTVVTVGRGRLCAAEVAPPAALAVAGVLAGARAAAAGDALLGLDAGIVLLSAAVLVRRSRLVWVSVAVAAPWTAALGYSLVYRLRFGVGGELGEPSAWAYGLVVLTAVGALAFEVQRRVEQSARERAELRRHTREQSVLDGLTGAVNRTGADLVAVPMIEHARRSGQAVSCLYADVDGLRQVNEAVGLRGGDEVLQLVARAIRDSVRTTDLVCRWTGDEFVVVGPGTGMSPLELERRVRASLLQEAPVATEVWGGKVSIGSATLVPWDCGDLSTLADKAEKDMQLRRSLRRQGRDASAGPGRPGGPGPSGPGRRPGARA